MAQRHASSWVVRRAARDEAGQQLAQRRLQAQQAPLVQQHRRGGGRGNLGEAGYVVDRLRGDCGGDFVVGEAAQRAGEHNLAATQHPEGAAGKGVSGDGLVQHAAGGGKPALRGGRRGNGQSFFRIHRLLASYCEGG